MNQQIVKFLEFKGKNIVYLSVDGTYWIAVKPICEALNVDYIQQYKNLRDDIVLKPVLCKHTMQVPGDQRREYVCLPEKYVYGWIFSIRSNSKELQEYKKECYDVLYNHFHGTITKRSELIKEKVDTSNKRSKLELALMKIPDYVEWLKLKALEIKLGKKLKAAEREEIQTAADLFNQKK